MNRLAIVRPMSEPSPAKPRMAPQAVKFTPIWSMSSGIRGIMTVLVTGGAGYIGAHVVRAFRAQGIDAVVIDDLSSGKDQGHFADGLAEECALVGATVVGGDVVRAHGQSLSDGAVGMSVERAAPRVAFRRSRHAGEPGLRLRQPGAPSARTWFRGGRGRRWSTPGRR